MKKNYLKPDFIVTDFACEIILTSPVGDDNIGNWIWGDDYDESF